MSYEQKWINFSKQLEEANPYTKLRWAKTKIPILKGEIQFLLAQAGLPSSVYNAKIVAYFVQFYSKNEHCFFIQDEETYQSSNIGRLLHERVKNLTHPEEVANQTLKIWLKTDSENFPEVLLKLLKYNRGITSPVKINLPALLMLAVNWDGSKEKSLTAITKEYFTSKYNQEGKQK